MRCRRLYLTLVFCLLLISGCKKPMVQQQPVVVHLFRDLYSPYAHEIDHRILEFQSSDLVCRLLLEKKPADPRQYSVAESIVPNSWESWNSDRDQALTAGSAAEAGAPERGGETQNPAWNDLDA